MAIYESKVSYSSNLITIWDKKTMKWHESFLYRGFKSLLSLTSNVKKEKLLKLALGKTFTEFQETEQKNLIATMINHAVRERDSKR